MNKVENEFTSDFYRREREYVEVSQRFTVQLVRSWEGGNEELLLSRYRGDREEIRYKLGITSV